MNSRKWRCSAWSWIVLGAPIVAYLLVTLVVVFPSRHGPLIGIVVPATLLVAAGVWLLARGRSDSGSDG